MINLIALDINKSKETTFVENLYIESFPLSERRPVATMFDFYENNPIFKIFIAVKDDEFVGFLTYWDLGNFIFAEHFAISPEFRNGGNGGKVMKTFISKMTKPIIIEVELPDTSLAERRIGFYQRLGYKLWDEILYVQPAYHQETDEIPMHIMSHGNIDVHSSFAEIKDTIYSKVYGC